MARTLTQQPPGHAHAARALRAAGEQIELSIDESHPAVAQLGDALGHLSDLLASLPAGVAENRVAALRQELARAITGLQYHDRMTQHLTHVRNYLLDSAGHAAGVGSDVEAWEQLHRGLSNRLLTDVQRRKLLGSFPDGYFGSFAAPTAEPARGNSDIELF